MKILKIIYTITVTLTLFVFISCSNSSPSAPVNTNSEETEEIDQENQTNPKDKNAEIEKPTECSLVFAGDILIHSAQLNSAFNPSDNSYNFDESFTKVKDYISNADLAICNSETSYLGENSHYEGYPTFNSPTSVLDALKNAGFAILSSAHNHTLDNSINGFNSTAKAITDKGFDLLGIKNQESDKNYLIKDIKGIKIGFTNFTYCESTANGEALNGILIPKELKNRINIFSDTNSNLDGYLEKMNETTPTWVNKYSDNNGKTHFIILNTKDVLTDSTGNNYSREVFNKVQRSSDSTNSIIRS